MPYTDKFIKNISKIQDVLSDKDSDNIENNILSIHKQFFDTKLKNKVNSYKSKGFSVSELFSILLFLPFLTKNTIFDLLNSGLNKISSSSKDSYYRLKKNTKINWRGIAYFFVKRFIKLVEEKGITNSELPKCLIIDDSVFPKTGKKIEKIGYVWDHVLNKTVLGYKALFLGYFDSKSFIPLDFSLHNEKGKRKAKPYGLTKKELRQQFKKKRMEKQPSKVRINETKISKITNSINMIKRAVSNRVKVDYVLADSWFICEEFIKGIRGIKKGLIHVVGLWKFSKQKVVYNGKEYNPSQLRVLLERKKSKRSRKIKAQYFDLIVDYKGIKLKFFYVKYHGTKKWKILVSTNLGLNFNKAIEIYNIRWTIEVYFKEAKQYLHIDGEKSTDFDAQIADITIKMIQYIMLALKKRFDCYETIGGIFKHSKEYITELTSFEKIWNIFIKLITEIVSILGVEWEEVLEKILKDEDYGNKIIAILTVFDKESNTKHRSKIA